MTVQMKVCVKSLSHTYSLAVLPTASVTDLLRSCPEELPKVVLFQGRKLAATQLLQSAGVEEGSTLLLLTEMRGREVLIRWNHQVKTMLCTEHMTVAELKDVCRRLGWKRNFEKMTYKGREIQDSSILLDCAEEDRPEFSLEKQEKPAETKGFDVTVKTLSGKDFFIEIDATLTVEDIKETISDREGYPQDMIRLICAGHCLCDYETVERLRLVPGSVIYVVLRLR